jgi:hypothetical protein
MVRAPRPQLLGSLVPACYERYDIAMRNERACQAKVHESSETMVKIFCAWIVNIALMLQVTAGAEIDRSQTANASPVGPAVGLTVIDEAGAAHSLSPDDFARLPQLSAKVNSHGKDTKFAGTSLVDLLKKSGVKFGDDLRGRRAATVAILAATDGYRVALSLLEIDPNTTDKVALVANQRDGNPLGDDGPYQLILPGDKRAVRWIRNLRTIRIINVRDFPLENPRPSGADGGQK